MCRVRHIIHHIPCTTDCLQNKPLRGDLIMQIASGEGQHLVPVHGRCEESSLKRSQLSASPTPTRPALSCDVSRRLRSTLCVWSSADQKASHPGFETNANSSRGFNSFDHWRGFLSGILLFFRHLESNFLCPGSRAVTRFTSDDYCAMQASKVQP